MSIPPTEVGPFIFQHELNCAHRCINSASKSYDKSLFKLVYTDKKIPQSAKSSLFYTFLSIQALTFLQGILRELDDDWTEDDICGIICDVSSIIEPLRALPCILYNLIHNLFARKKRQFEITIYLANGLHKAKIK